MIDCEKVPVAELIRRYLETQVGEPESVLAALRSLNAKFNPTGFVLLQCIVMDSSRLGHHVIAPFGPNNTLKEIPSEPLSPRGLCSDISSAVAWADASEITPSSPGSA